MGYFLVDRFIYSKEKLNLENTQTPQVFEEHHPALDEKIVYLDADVECLFLCHQENIGHFFLDYFFPFYSKWRKNKKKVLISIFWHQVEVRIDFIKSIIDQEYLIFAEQGVTYFFQNLELFPDGQTNIGFRHINRDPDFKEICNEIRNRAYVSNGIVARKTRNLIATRSGLLRKNLLNVDVNFLFKHEIYQVDLTTCTFKELLEILSTAKVFVYVVGAGLFNLLFLEKDVKVIEINPYTNASWAKHFGLADMLPEFEVFVSDNIVLNSHGTQGDPRLDAHINFDQSLKEKILNKLSN